MPLFGAVKPKSNLQIGLQISAIKPRGSRAVRSDRDAILTGIKRRIGNLIFGRLRDSSRRSSD